MSDPTRRAVLKAAPVASLAVALPSAVCASTHPESEIMHRFRACIALRDWINTTDEDLPAECLALIAMERELMALPSPSMQDMAAKVAIWTCYLENDWLSPDALAR